MRAQVAAPALVLALGLAACGGDASTNDPLSGAQLVVDVKGDHAKALNADGVEPKNPPDAADVTGVRLDASEDSLSIRIAIAGSPYESASITDPLQGPAWFMQLFADTKAASPAYFVAIVREGEPSRAGEQIKGWRLSVCPGTEVCNEPAEGATLKITESEVRADIPLTLLSKLKNPFTWAMQSYWNETQDPVQAHSDWVPEAARPSPGATTYSEPDTRATFPPEGSKK
ncbi:MAG TPA: hypothetical protein VM841_06050 [Actinomycetota bacterium]|nr:hypothetical protein [Actinomycetota bacterium]